jgi:hypothetical protein
VQNQWPANMALQLTSGGLAAARLCARHLLDVPLA